MSSSEKATLFTLPIELRQEIFKHAVDGLVEEAVIAIYSHLDLYPEEYKSCCKVDDATKIPKFFFEPRYYAPINQLPSIEANSSPFKIDRSPVLRPQEYTG